MNSSPSSVLFTTTPIFILLSLLITFYGAEAQGGPTYLYHSCSNNTVFARNSTYERNLRTLLSNLSSNSSDYVGGFSNATVGEGSSDRIYGLFLCRGDQSPASCRNCVATATQQILDPQRCPVEKVSTIWYATDAILFSFFILSRYMCE